MAVPATCRDEPGDDEIRLRDSVQTESRYAKLLPYSSFNRPRRAKTSASEYVKNRALCEPARCTIQFPCGMVKTSLGPQVKVSLPMVELPWPSTPTQMALAVLRYGTVVAPGSSCTSR